MRLAVSPEVSDFDVVIWFASAIQKSTNPPTNANKPYAQCSVNNTSRNTIDHGASNAAVMTGLLMNRRTVCRSLRDEFAEWFWDCIFAFKTASNVGVDKSSSNLEEARDRILFLTHSKMPMALYITTMRIVRPISVGTDLLFKTRS